METARERNQLPGDLPKHLEEQSTATGAFPIWLCLHGRVHGVRSGPADHSLQGWRKKPILHPPSPAVTLKPTWNHDQTSLHGRPCQESYLVSLLSIIQGLSPSPCSESKSGARNAISTTGSNLDLIMILEDID